MDMNKEGDIRKCFICSANCVAAGVKVDEGKNKLCQRFCTLLCRYLNIESGFSNQYKTLRLSNDKKKAGRVEQFQIKLCDRCLPEVETFCRIYEDWCSLKLKLNWSVKKITELMNPASKGDKGEFSGQTEQTELDWLRRQVSLCGEAKLKTHPELKIKKLQIGNRNNLDSDLDSLRFQQGHHLQRKQDDDDDHQDRVNNESIWKATPNPSNFTMLSDFFQTIHSRIGSVSPSPNKILKLKSFNCRFCEKSFLKRYNLDRHEAIHRGPGASVSEDKIDEKGVVDVTKKAPKTRKISIPAFKCTDCNKNFTRRSDLHRHQQQVHSEMRPFHCQFCGRGFFAKYYLKLHETTHTGKRQYCCNICGAQFARKRYCKLHQLGVHKVTDGIILNVAIAGENCTESTASGSSSKKKILKNNGNSEIAENDAGPSQSAGGNDKKKPRVYSSFRSNIKDAGIPGPSQTQVFLVKTEPQNSKESENAQDGIYSILPDIESQGLTRSDSNRQISFPLISNTQPNPTIAENMVEDYKDEEENFILPDFD